MESATWAQWNNDLTQDPTLPIYTGHMTTTPPTTEEHNGEVLSLLAEFVEDSMDPREEFCPDKISSHLDDLMIEMHDGQLMKNLEKLRGPSRLESIFQLVRYSVYLSSNNLLSDSKTDKFVK